MSETHKMQQRSACLQTIASTVKLK